MFQIQMIGLLIENILKTAFPASPSDAFGLFNLSLFNCPK